MTSNDFNPEPRAGRWLTQIETLLSRVAAATLALTMLVIVADVLMRYAFNAPFAWTYQLVQYNLLVLLYFFALAETQRRRENISVHVLDHLLAPRARRILDGVVSALILIFAVALLWTGVVALEKSVIRAEFAPGLINWPKWPSYAIFVLGTSVFALRLTWDCYLGLTGRSGPEVTA